jgi:hypothetical protein
MNAMTCRQSFVQTRRVVGEPVAQPSKGCPSPELHPSVCRLIFAGHAGHDDRVLETILLIARALALACRGHQELVLENIALRQQLKALQRTVRRPVRATALGRGKKPHTRAVWNQPARQGWPRRMVIVQGTWVSRS